METPDRRSSLLSPSSAATTRSRTSSRGSTGKSSKQTQLSVPEDASPCPKPRRGSKAKAAAQDDVLDVGGSSPGGRTDDGGSVSSYQGAGRPPARSRTSSSFKKQSPEEIDSRINDYIMSPAAKRPPGVNYVLAVTRKVNGTSVQCIKIGYSERSVGKRKTEILSQCKHEPKTSSSESCTTFASTRDARARTRTASTSKVDESVAREVSVRWVAFCAKEPWGQLHELHGFWTARINNRRCYSEEDKPDGRDGQRRLIAEIWREFAAATVREQLAFDAVAVVWTFASWSWLSLGQAAYLMSVRFPNPIPVVFFAVVVMLMLAQRDLAGMRLVSWMDVKLQASDQSPKQRATGESADSGDVESRVGDDVMDADENGDEAEGGSVVTLSAPCTPRSPPETIVIEDSEEEAGEGEEEDSDGDGDDDKDELWRERIVTSRCVVRVDATGAARKRRRAASGGVVAE
ncbi:hypothetical protein ACCO45_010397 [Purpureocillium lilacinum]|uniref:Uncharacterized protein n=1 Tax=Purpureocillium lilacinum TaxID=33203 RepID=A0ACC4DG65_PURLI